MHIHTHMHTGRVHVPERSHGREDAEAMFISRYEEYEEDGVIL